MGSAIRPSDLDGKWLGFLTDVDAALSETIELHCLGGFVIAARYGLPRPTADLDYLEIIPPGAQEGLQRIAGEHSPLARKHGLYFQHVALVSAPDRYDERLTELFPSRFRNLRLRALDPHDLALSKLSRNASVDREDVRFLARTVPLDPVVLRRRYEDELRPIILGSTAEHDQTLRMWLEAYF
jgi:hypothetical protein